MKRKLFFLLALMLGLVTSIKAEQTPENGKTYYMYNEEADLFLSRGSNWGTRAIAQPIGMPWVIEVLGSGNYKLRMYDITNGSNTGNGYGDNDFTDNGTPIEFTPSGNASDGFTLQNGSNYLTCPATTGDVNRTSTASKWKFLTQAEYNAVLANRAAQQEAAIAAAKGIVIPDGQTLNDVVSDADNWASTTVNDGIPNKTTWPVTGVTSRSGNQNAGNYGEEIYQGGGWFSKTISNLKPGIYKVSVRAQKRVKGNGDCYNMGQAGYPVSDAYFNANGYIIPIKAWYEDCTSNSNPNSTDAFVSIVNNGGYTKEGFVYVGNDGKLVMQARSEAYWGASWFLFNGISYTYYNNEVSDEDATAILADAASVTGKPMLGTVQDALTSAATTFDGARTIANYNVLSEAITNANNSIAAYANAKGYLDEAKPILDNTNVYTASAYATYYADPKAKYDARTLTNEEGNALQKMGGWHASNTLDDILLSSWTIGGEQCKDYTKALYINTWSTEGNTDGSEFFTPFFEYWVGDDNVLAANTIVATVEGLNPSATYSFTIRARVRQTDKKTKITDGVTMKVGDGEPVDISAGAIFGTGPFFIGNFTAVGQTDADGKMTMTMTVADNSNISWLSFYNAKWTEGEDLSAYIADYEFALGLVNEAIATDVAYAAMQTDLKAAATTYAKGNVDETSKADLIAAKDALESALATYNATVTPLKGSSIEGWTNTGNNGQFHVNTWSGEGATDGSGMLTPFIENWIAKGTSLTDATMSYTAEGLTPGYYRVTALIRSLNEAGGADPAGSFIFANDAIERAYGTNSAACTNGVYGNPVVYGLVGEDGKLTIGVKVIKANVNWVSWKNFVYSFVGTELTQEIADNLTEEARTFENPGADAAVAQANAISALSTLSDANYVAAGKAIDAAYKAIDRDFTALKAAITEAEAGTRGFEVGEFAPYNVAPALAIDQTSEANTQAEIDAAAAACVANTTDVDAIYNGNFSSAQDWGLTGWTRTNGWGQQRDDLPAESGANTNYGYYNQPGSLQYGNAGEYTMPLKENTIYELSFKYASWENNSNTGMTVSVLNGEDGMAAMSFDGNGKKYNTEGAFVTKTLVFATGAAGNYVLTLANNGNTVMTDVSITKAASQTLTFADDAAMPSYAPGTYPRVEVTRTLVGNQWNTLVLPFEYSNNAWTIKEFTASDNEKLTFSDVEGGTMTAGTPYLVKPNENENTASIVATNVAVVSTSSGVTQGDFTFTPVYTQNTITGDGSNYFVATGTSTLYRAMQDIDIMGFRAYFHYSGTPSAREVVINFDGETAIDAVEAAEEGEALKDGKYLIDGQIVIVKNGVKYSANGQILK